MKRLPIVAAAAVSMVVAVAGQATAQSDSTHIKLDAIAAVVGSVPITVYDIEQRLVDSVRNMRARGQPMPNEAQRRAYITDALNSLIDEEVLLAKAKELHIEVSDAEVTSGVDQQIKEISARFPSDAEFRRGLVAAGLGTPEEYRRSLMVQLRRDLTIKTLVQKLMSPGDNKIPAAIIPETRVAEEFARLQKGSVPLPKRQASITWRQMVIAPTPSPVALAAALTKAESLRTEIKAGGDFERIAKRESMDAATKDLGGDLGWRKRGDLPEELERLVFGPFALRPGDISAVTHSPFGFHIIRLDKANPPAEVKVRQILIIPKIDSTDVARAAKLTDSLVALLRKGVSFDTIAHKFHDPAEDAPGLMPETAFDTLPPSYQAGFKDAKKDSVVSFPIPTVAGHPKFVIAQVMGVNQAGDYTYDELKLRIRANLQQITQMRRYIDAQKKSMYVHTLWERAYGAGVIFDAPP
jgi:peptidyl-prolyl cis-trans isomerase SurA